jgi:anti-sigma-K factor RskA
MNRPILFDATPALNRTPRTVTEHRFALWAFVAVLAVTACTVLILHASLTPEQRIALFEQSGFFP